MKRPYHKTFKLGPTNREKHFRDGPSYHFFKSQFHYFIKRGLLPHFSLLNLVGGKTWAFNPTHLDKEKSELDFEFIMNHPSEGGDFYDNRNYKIRWDISVYSETKDIYTGFPTYDWVSFSMGEEWLDYTNAVNGKPIKTPVGHFNGLYFTDTIGTDGKVNPEPANSFMIDATIKHWLSPYGDLPNDGSLMNILMKEFVKHAVFRLNLTDSLPLDLTIDQFEANILLSYFYPDAI